MHKKLTNYGRAALIALILVGLALLPSHALAGGTASPGQTTSSSSQSFNFSPATISATGSAAQVSAAAGATSTLSGASTAPAMPPAVAAVMSALVTQLQTSGASVANIQTALNNACATMQTAVAGITPGAPLSPAQAATMNAALALSALNTQLAAP